MSRRFPAECATVIQSEAEMCSAGATCPVTERDQHCAPDCASRDVDPVAPVRPSPPFSASAPARWLSLFRASRCTPGDETAARNDTLSASRSDTCRCTRRATRSRTPSCTRHCSPCDKPIAQPVQTPDDVAPAATTGDAVARHRPRHVGTQFWAK